MLCKLSVIPEWILQKTNDSVRRKVFISPIPSKTECSIKILWYETQETVNDATDRVFCKCSLIYTEQGVVQTDQHRTRKMTFHKYFISLYVGEDSLQFYTDKGGPVNNP